MSLVPAGGYPAGNGTTVTVPAEAPVGGLPMLPTYIELIREIADTDFVPDAMRRKPGAILACFMKGYEIGFGPMQALDSIDIIKGKAGLKPEAMRGLIVQAGHTIRTVENSEDAVTLRVRRKEWPEGEFEDFRWTMDDARRAELTSNPSWRKYPRSMLIARATAEAARAVFADVIKGLSYTPEEIESFSVPSRDTTPAAPAAAPAAEPAAVKEHVQRRPPPGLPRQSGAVAETPAEPPDPFDVSEPVAALALRLRALPAEKLAEYERERKAAKIPSARSVTGWTPDLMILATGLLAEVEHGPQPLSNQPATVKEQEV